MEWMVKWHTVRLDILREHRKLVPNGTIREHVMQSTEGPGAKEMMT